MTTEQVLNFHVPKVFKFRMPLTVPDGRDRCRFRLGLDSGAAYQISNRHTPSRHSQSKGFDMLFRCAPLLILTGGVSGRRKASVSSLIADCVNPARRESCEMSGGHFLLDTAAVRDGRLDVRDNPPRPADDRAACTTETF